MKQMGLSFEMYCSDYDEVYPPAYEWKSRLQPYIKTTEINRCPSRKQLPWYYGQGYNIGCSNPPVAGFPERSMAQIESPSYKLLIVEWDRCSAGPPCGPPGLFAGGALCWWAVCRIHNGGSNVTFADGHAKWLDPTRYHSTTEKIDDQGNPVPPDAVPVDEATWRNYWDTEWEVH